MLLLRNGSGKGLVVAMHDCPAPRCERRVLDRFLSCRQHWAQLSPAIRSAVWHTSHLPLTDPNRREAVMAAIEEWRLLDAMTP